MLIQILSGIAIQVGNHIDTDAIIQARYCTSFDPQSLAAHVFEGQLDLSKHSLQESFLVAGVNFGCGSAREHAAIAIQGAGFRGVIAKSFSRTFFRNAINIALPVFELSSAAEITSGEKLEIDPSRMILHNRSTGRQYDLVPFPPVIRNIIEAGGMIEFARQRLSEKRKKKTNDR
jgi:3-isopropylmalate/(R)-2-methylmalate dehydratase small subunit